MKKILLGLFGTLAFQVFAQVNSDSSKTINGVNYIQHTVVSGETLYGLSKNYNTTVDNLRSANNNLTTLKLGSTIWVPSPITNTSNGSKDITDSYTVQTGETLYAISKKLNVSVSDLKTWNGLTDNSISVGQVLKVKQTITTEVRPVKTAKVENIETVKKEQPLKQAAEQKKKVDVVNTTDVSESTVAEATPVKKTVVVQRSDETTEKGLAKVVKSANMNEDRCFIKHPTVPVGNIVVVINDRTGKMAYCRVIENISTANLNNSKIQMTQAVADKIGLKGDTGEVTIKYATL